jgi:acyl carrier protein
MTTTSQPAPAPFLEPSEPIEQDDRSARVISSLDQAIRDGLGLEGSTDIRTIAWGQTEEWDSVAHMQLVAALEATFGIMVDTDDVIAMSDYWEIRRILRDHHGIEFGE